MLKDFLRILRIQLNVFGLFSGYDKTLLAYSRNKELRIRGKKSSLSSTITDDFKETVFRKNRTGEFFSNPQKSFP